MGYKIKLSSECTVYQADLVAILRAYERILSTKNHKYNIYSDSRSAIEKIANVNTTLPIAADIRKKLKTCGNQDKLVSLFWIKALDGIVGNGRADELAKEAVIKTKTKSQYDGCPVSFVKRQIHLGTFD